MLKTLRSEYLVSYDMENTKHRTKVFKELQKTGMKPVQKSVFWGYLTKAEITFICRFIEKLTENGDRAIITRININNGGFSYLVGYDKDEFHDWEENCVV